ncbi:VOC family protein [Jiella sp. MQZ9-1]|uniref:VOC family protein n=1 Tax=Jiella flava TaxID=2816857 RepID=A0A939FTY3_9HYPH|nr:VOC family protein [Jiella flava]MBO0661365.1 VOC family protein [Jiella flava]MCD2470010.1 VOC family protein [Jiella flava]
MSGRSIARLSLLVDDYDAAIAWFCRCLDFELLEDTRLGDAKRWVRLAPRGGGGAELLLAEAADAEQHASIGRQDGGRVWLFLQTDDFDRDHARILAEGVRFWEAPRVESYGTVAVFEDLCGNRWDLIQPA